MAAPIITLTSDFGTGSPYVAQVKGVLLSALPAARLVDVAHDLPAYSVRHAEVLLRSTAFAFPLGSVHLVVVDPGVGTARRPIAVQARGLTFVGPDNGVLGLPLAQPGARAVVLDRSELFRQPLTATFHGRDLFAPVAAELAAGLPLDEVGTPITDAIASTLPRPQIGETQLVGETLVADRFGNLTTNIPFQHVTDAHEVRVMGKVARRVRTYGDAPMGVLLALAGSDGFLELALREGSAAQHLGQEGGLVVHCPKES